MTSTVQAQAAGRGGAHAEAASEAVLEGLRQLGAHVKRARKEAFKESRVDFARRLGCSPMTLDRVERGDPGVAAGYLVAALHAMAALHDVVEAASPKLLIATLVPASFPTGFAGLPSDDS